jgi:hypothetical protein
MEDSVPFSSVFGKVSHVQKDSKVPGLIRVTICGQELLLQRSQGDGMDIMGLLRLTKRNKRIFLIYQANQANGTHEVLAGWNNPDERYVRFLQSHILAKVGLSNEVRYYYPTWKVGDDHQ